MPRDLTTKQRLFIAAYKGNGADAARQAGYKGDNHALAVVAEKLLTNSDILSAIQTREDREVNRKVKTRVQRQEYWSAMMDSPTTSAADRLAASALLARSEGDFIDKVEIDVTDMAERIRRGRERAQ